MSRQYWVKGTWGLAVAVASTAAAIAAAPQVGPQQNGQQQNPNQNQPIQNQNQQLQNQQFQNQNGQPGQQDGRTFGRPGMNRGMGVNGFGANQEANLDHFLIKVLVKANKDEIEMGKLAQQRSQDPAIKQLATQMVQDHTRFNEQLEHFKGATPGHDLRAGAPAQQRSTAFRANPGEQNQQQPQETQQLQQQQQQQLTPAQRLQNQQNAAQNGQQNGQNNQNAQQNWANGQRNEMADQGRREHMMHGTAGRFATIMEQVDRNLQQSLVRDLSSKEGQQFDRCYLSAQLFGHMWVVESLKVFEQNASPQLKPILQEGLQTSEQHLQHIKSVLAKMENAPQGNAGLQHRVGRVVR
jgi:predicted outer membrane protein